MFVFFILCMFLLKPRQDVVFEAIDMSQYIRLFEEDRDFVLCFDANSTYTGTYTLVSDTVYLTYREMAEGAISPAGIFPAGRDIARPEKLYIDEGASLIASMDGASFSAEISMDLRHKAQEARAYSPEEESTQRARILAFAGLKEKGFAK